MIRTFIIEDDFRVADIHSAYVSKVPGFEVIGKAHTAAAAYEAVLELQPDLVLLDLYLPDQHGLELFAKLQQLPRGQKIDVFVISAARDSASVKEALQLGAANYIVKPFSQVQLADRLIAYKEAFQRLAEKTDVSQADVDRVTALMRGSKVESMETGSAKNPTVEAIRTYLAKTTDALSASEVAEGLGISRATAQRYLSQMVDRKLLHLELQYGTAGRPINKYRNHRHSSI
ncbi:MAG: response regulator [Actinomycetes bacterium]